jgi:hypothetical protein
MVAMFAGPGGILCAFVNDPSVLHRKIGKDDLISQFEQIVLALAGPDPTPTEVLRARCAIGCVQSGILGTVMARLRATRGEHGIPAGDRCAAFAADVGSAWSTWSPSAPFESTISDDARRMVVNAALAVLGERG